MLLFTGKGGVGKTSVAAATAVRAARRGHRVLVTSTDPAHSLADALDVPLRDGPTPVALPPAATDTGSGRVRSTGRLHGQQIDAQQRLERHWNEVRSYLVDVLAAGGVGDVQAEELVLLPGLDELFALIDLRAQIVSGRYDLVVVDCAPTAETLRLLALPEALRWYVDRFLGPGRRLARVVRPFTRAAATSGVPVPDDEVFDAVGRVHADLAAVHRLLQDPDRASVRLVTAAERLVVAETERTATSLALFGYAADAVVVNRLLPETVRDPHLERWKARQAGHLGAIRAAFSPTPVLTAPLLDDELDGVAALGVLGDAVYGERDETAVLATDRPLEVRATGDGYRLRIAVPGVGRDGVSLHRRAGELHLKVAGVARTLTLPAALRRLEVRGARVDDGVLEVRFAPAEVSPTADAADLGEVRAAGSA